jgi:murein DD-endopeptidase MepM/ murein hydrolase activator NlpD
MRTPIGLPVAWIVLALLAGARVTAAAPFDAAAAREKAHRLTPCVSRAEAGPLWREFDDTMRAALKDSLHFVSVLETLTGSTGTLDSLLDETVTSPQPGAFVYRANARFSKWTTPLELIFSFDEAGRVSGFLVRPPAGTAKMEYPSSFLDYRTKTRLRLPFRGEWTVFWGGRTLDQNYHAFTRDQRFALDLLIVRDQRTHDGDGRKCSDYFCYGQPVLAPAAGTVVWEQDSLPDNEPGKMDPSHATGNSLILDHGNGEYSLIAHLQPGSLRFRVGDRVPADAQVGRCGNSGNTSEPHVHFHLQNRPMLFDADGLPAQFADVLVDGERQERVELMKGERVRRADQEGGLTDRR